MAKNKESVDQNQMSLFDKVTDDVKFVEIVKESQLIAEEIKVASVENSDSITTFLKSKDVSFEISGQVEMTREDFTNSTPENSRFVSISIIPNDKVLVTPSQEDGSLTLKIMKDNFPGYVTQLQRVTDSTFIDSFDNLNLLERLENIIEGKTIATIKNSSKSKEIEKEFLANKDSDSDIDCEIEVAEAAPIVGQVKKDRYKPQ